jgi:hypothetical protein
MKGFQKILKKQHKEKETLKKKHNKEKTLMQKITVLQLIN